MSQSEHTTELTVPNPNPTRPTTGTSEPASRAETLTNQPPPEKISQEKVAEEGTPAAPASIKSGINNEKEKQGGVDPITVTDADTTAGNGLNGEGQHDDGDRYLTGFRLFLVFVYVISSTFYAS